MTPVARICLLLAALVPLAAASPARAWVIREDLEVPVHVKSMRGAEIEHPIHVGLFYESSAPTPRPLLVFNHGRAPTSAGFAKVKVEDFDTAARWFARFGFLVAVPVRVGYGRTGGPDAEFSGSNCTSRNYPPAYRAGADETMAVLEALRKRPDASQDRAIVAGQSFGGTIAVAVAARNPRGVQGTINFSGGGGGNPDKHPMQPCSPERLHQLFAGYGKTARLPTLWLYSENDQYFGPSFPRDWFEGFRHAGGQGAFQQFPPVGTNGHFMFSRAPQLWQPRVQEFLGTLGYKPL